MYRTDTETPKNNKRNKPEHDSPIDEESCFQRSKIIARTPTKEPIKKDTYEEIPGGMEEIRAMFADIKGEIANIRGDTENIKMELQSNNEEIKQLREEMQKMKKEWMEEKEELIYKLEATEARLERIEKDKIRNNIVISGIEVKTQDRKVVKDTVQNMLKQELNIEVQIKDAYKISESKCIAEMNKWEDKLEVLQRKINLKGKNIYIDAEMTVMERKIQKTIRDIGKEQKIRGANVKIGYQRIEINGKIMKWCQKENKLREIKQMGTVSKN